MLLYRIELMVDLDMIQLLQLVVEIVVKVLFYHNVFLLYLHYEQFVHNLVFYIQHMCHLHLLQHRYHHLLLHYHCCYQLLLIELGICKFYDFVMDLNGNHFQFVDVYSHLMRVVEKLLCIHRYDMSSRLEP